MRARARACVCVVCVWTSACSTGTSDCHKGEPNCADWEVSYPLMVVPPMLALNLKCRAISYLLRASVSALLWIERRLCNATTISRQVLCRSLKPQVQGQTTDLLSLQCPWIDTAGAGPWTSMHRSMRWTGSLAFPPTDIVLSTHWHWIRETVLVFKGKNIWEHQKRVASLEHTCNRSDFEWCLCCNSQQNYANSSQHLISVNTIK